MQIGGPIKKDKVFFFVSVQRYEYNRYADSPTVLRGEVSPRFNVKITCQLTPNDTLMGSVQYDNYNQKGRLGDVPGYQVTDQSRQTIIQDSPEWVYNAQYRKVFGVVHVPRGEVHRLLGVLRPQPDLQGPLPLRQRQRAQSTGGAGYVYQADRTRNQLNASLTQYAKMAGTHNFKFGVEIERSTIRDRFAYVGPNDTYYVDYLGEPYYAYSSAYDLQGTNKRESYYAQDQWKVGRFTANLGFRYDNIRGHSTALNQNIFQTRSVGPRLGFALDVTGKGTSVVRAFYGRMYEAAAFDMYKRAMPGIDDLRRLRGGADLCRSDGDRSQRGFRQVLDVRQHQPPEGRRVQRLVRAAVRENVQADRDLHRPAVGELLQFGAHRRDMGARHDVEQHRGHNPDLQLGQRLDPGAGT